ncbi:DUF2537 domain-containing protein [Antrihabitans sp. YC3-6]|uniref:DUF2537 domain-containing protein n=1 Tax=Antrihabitans stalagmiti TaxID=2799499 RepID=A0A934NST8_9NOCA|nr:DUF2537 domain-containing protein [Antrihabitans stalagmiti]MBJ8340660.1 DUF2537 domain-containing protein [Antrihabitans stalagmiti]
MSTSEPSTPQFAAPTAEPTPWQAGLLVTAFAAILTTCALYGFGIALANVHPALAVVINLVAVGGTAPTVWGWRAIPVVRWVALGIGVGVVVGWLGLLISAV